MVARIVAALLLAVGALSHAHGAPIRYVLTMTVDEMSSQDIAGIIRPPFIGQEYYAYLTVDDSILSSDGQANIGEVFAFDAQIGDRRWRIPGGAGIGNPGHGPYLPFDVENGKVVGVGPGWVYGGADEYGITFDVHQFSTYGVLWFFCFPDSVCGAPLHQGYKVINLRGDLAVTPLSEPGTIALLAVWFAGLTVIRPRKIGRR